MINMEEITLLNDISYELSQKVVADRLQLNENFRSSSDFKNAYMEALKLIHPRAVYGLGMVKEKNKNIVIIENQKFSSQILRKNLESVEIVFPFLITLGRELETNTKNVSRVTQQFYMDFIGDIVLQQCIAYLERHLKKKFSYKHISSMSPGSLKDWPIDQQVPLFSLFGHIADDFGVSLTSSLLMSPRKSISGIAFSTTIPFISCQLCLRNRCPGRRAAYNADKCKEYGLDA
jgi:hypothetical protein